MSSRQQIHCSDEHLIAWLDGELGRGMSNSISRHLELCWRCRSRCSELGSSALELARLLRTAPYPSIKEEVQAHERFCQGLARYEQQAALLSQRRTLRSQMFGFLRRPLICTSTAAAAVVILVISVSLFKVSSDHGASREFLTKLQGRDDALLNSTQVVHQSVNIDVIEGSNTSPATTSHMDIWQDGPRSRFVSRYTSEDVSAKYAVRRNLNARYQLTSDGIVSLDKSTGEMGPTLADCAFSHSGASAAEILAAWIHQRQWRPVTIAKDFAKFVGPNNTSLRVEREVNGTREYALLRAQRTVDGHRVEASLLVDTATGEAQAQSVRFITPHRSGEIRIRVNAELIRPSDVSPAVFKGDPIIDGATVPAETWPQHVATSHMSALKVEATEILDNFSVPRSSVTDFTTTADGHLSLRLDVASQVLRGELLQAFNSVPDKDMLQLEITVSSPPDRHDEAQTGAQLSPRFMHAWDEAFDEGLTFVDLRNRFPHRQLESLSPAARMTLHWIVNKHLRALRERLSRTNAEFVSVSGSKTQGANSLQDSPPSDYNDGRNFIGQMDRIDDVIQVIEDRATPEEERRRAMDMLHPLFNSLQVELQQFQSDTLNYFAPPVPAGGQVQEGAVAAPIHGSRQ